MGFCQQAPCPPVLFAAHGSHPSQLALANLTHPTLLPEFADDVLAVLAQKSPSPCLALAYYHALTPVLRTARSLRLLFASLVSTNVAEAFWFSRTFDDGTTGRDTAANGTRRQLFESLIDGVLGGEGAEGEYVRHASQQQHQVRKSTAASGAGRYAKGSSGTSAQSGHHDESEVADEEQDAQRAASRAAELVGLPLDSDEEAWFEDYLLRGDGRRLPRARDAVLARRALTRRLVPAMGGAGAGTGERLPTATMPGRWGTLVEGLRAATAGVAGQGRDGR